MLSKRKLKETQCLKDALNPGHIRLSFPIHDYLRGTDSLISTVLADLHPNIYCHPISNQHHPSLKASVGLF